MRCNFTLLNSVFIPTKRSFLKPCERIIFASSTFCTKIGNSFGKIILPFTVLHRLECQLESTKDAVLAMATQIAGKNLDEYKILVAVSQNPFYKASQYSLATLGGTKTRANLEDYISRFSDNVRVIF